MPGAAVIVSVGRKGPQLRPTGRTAEVAPGIVFQAAGPSAGRVLSGRGLSSIKVPCGVRRGINNGNAPGPLVEGRREHQLGRLRFDRDFTRSDSCSEVFKGSRGRPDHSMLGHWVRAGARVGPCGDVPETRCLAQTTFESFSPLRLSALWAGPSRTRPSSFLEVTVRNPAATSGFCAVFCDVDSPDGGGRGVRQYQRRASSEIQDHDCRRQAAGQERHPTGPGTANEFFLCILFRRPVHHLHPHHHRPQDPGVVYRSAKWRSS